MRDPEEGESIWLHISAGWVKGVAGRTRTATNSVSGYLYMACPAEEPYTGMTLALWYRREDIMTQEEYTKWLMVQ